MPANRTIALRQALDAAYRAYRATLPDWRAPGWGDASAILPARDAYRAALSAYLAMVDSRAHPHRDHPVPHIPRTGET